ncbi:MAG: response regulator [Proteobacteria bacterium]|nr:response regulator [Pseudomonadota bacterium]
MQKGHKILVVDDDQTNLKFLREILEDEYHLLTVDTGEEALSAIHEFNPKIVLLDIMLPGVSGYEVCEKIRQDEKLSQVKIILISAKAMINERQKGYEAGADDYITKPFDHEELLLKVQSILEQVTS